MKRYSAIVLLSLISAAFAAAQAPEVGTPDANRMADGLPQQALREVSVDKFEQEGYWEVYISTDCGFSSGKLFTGAPQAKQPIPGEEELNITDDKVYGIKVDFLRRGHASIFVTATRPVPIEGISKTISVWVAGRNYNHRLSIMIMDSRGKYFELYMGRMNFQGWKKMTVSIPPQQANGENGVIQNDFHYSANSGVSVVGFKIDVDPMEAYGTYYAYFDDLRAVTDLFSENNRDPDDPRDDW
ncbi:MAG: flagellar filament outer layer protein FlaA [Spirochaetaceae bacterium]|jgi:hypothetical protein|nr:flagellar filament outer layer protein FlaA [Spirochaetaceae bacterium]